MTTIIPFLPSNLVAPKFKATFDGETYQVVITWNISAQRFYVNIYDDSGNWIVTVPMIQTPPAREVTGVEYDIKRRVVTVFMVSPTEWPIPLGAAGTLTVPGTIVDYTLENFSPSILNTKWRSLHINDTSFSFDLANDPRPVIIIGTVTRNLNMVAGIFRNSKFIYRNGAFEVTP